MCCYTHNTVDGYPGALAADESVRCQCGYGGNCPRRATQEDMRCDICGGRIDDKPRVPKQHYDSVEEFRRGGFVDSQDVVNVVNTDQYGLTTRRSNIVRDKDVRPRRHRSLDDDSRGGRTD